MPLSAVRISGIVISFLPSIYTHDIMSVKAMVSTAAPSGGMRGRSRGAAASCEF